MAGILDSKERILDFIVTQEGKRQAGIGELKMKYATFTDLHTFYDTSGSLSQPKLASEASSRIFFEAFSRYQDTIVPELEAGYSMRPFRTSDFLVAGGSISSGTFSTGIHQSLEILSGSDTINSLPLVLDGITQNFENQRVIGTTDEFSLYQDLELSPRSVNFHINESSEYFRAGNSGETNLEDIPSIFSDRRFSNFANFMYLPPVNQPLPGQSLDQSSRLGDYPFLNEKQILSLNDLNNSLSGKQKKTITFSKTSRRNNIVVQFFEKSPLGIEKLSVVDFGQFEDDEPLSSGKHVLFVGKIQRDSFGSETFLCLFTVVID